LRHNPFPVTPPARIRARVYHYRFTTRGERRETGAWWAREVIGEFLRPIALPRSNRAPTTTRAPAQPS
jgi:hypothetical protein